MAGLFAHALHSGLDLWSPGFDGFAQNGLYNGLIVVAACLCLARGVLVPAERGPWLLLGIGLATWAGGEIYFTAVLADQSQPPYPSLSDALYLAFYPASYFALVLMARSRLREFHLSQWIDGLIAALAVTSFGAALLLEPVISSTGGTAATVATDLAYPLGDILLLALVVGMFGMTGWRPGRSWSILGAGLVAVAAADGVFLWQATNGSYVEGTLLDTAWLAATLLIGYAACQPPHRAAPARLEGWSLIVMPSALTLATLGLLVWAAFNPGNDVTVVFAAATLIAGVVRMGMTFGENMRMLASSRSEALTDALTSLGNRRRLMNDLADQVPVATPAHPRLLLIFDLDGFKNYNDTFGHPAGDALLARLGRNLEAAVQPYGTAYRLGGDEFCALVEPEAPGAKTIIAGASAALSEQGKGFAIGASCGSVAIPLEADRPERALQTADERLYGDKTSRRKAAANLQTRDVLLQALHERVPDLLEHVADVAGLAGAVSRQLGLATEETDEIVRAAELHDIGKVAVPDEILQKPGDLDETDWRFIRQHTLIGERILGVAPAMVPVAKIVRSTHEHWDGSGYPDGQAGAEIPIGARVVAVCDAYHALTSDRPYRKAQGHKDGLRELRRSAGSQFDPMVVDAFCEAFEEAPEPAQATEADPAIPSTG